MLGSDALELEAGVTDAVVTEAVTDAAAAAAPEQTEAEA
jgi:hypothetical protein